jgi:DNA polymerase III delta subunit
MLSELLCPSTWNTKPNNPAYDRPPDLDQFANEIDKLALVAFPGAIENGHIQDMSAGGQADRLFPLIDAVFASEGATAIRELGAAINLADDAPRIAAQLTQQAELLAVMATAGSTDPVEVGRALGLSNPNRMLAIGKSLRRYRGGPRPLLNAALETERELKTGMLRQPADGVYALVERALALGRQTREGGN